MHRHDRMALPDQDHDIPRPRLFEATATHPPLSETTGDLWPRLGDATHGRWMLQVQGQRTARCTIPYPAGWRWLAPREPDSLGSFVPPVMRGPELTVRVVPLTWEVDPLAYLMHDCRKRGLSTTLARPDPGHDASRFELGGTRDSDGALWKSAALLHGGRLVIVETSAPVELWHPLRGALRSCRKGLDVAPPSPSAAIEPQRSHRSEDIRFALPTSWIRTNHRRRDGDERLVFAAPRCRSVIVIDGGSKSRPLHLRHASVFEALQTMGWGSPRRVTLQRSGIRSFSGILDGELEASGDPFRVRIAHRRMGRVHVDYTAVLPTSDTHAIDAMRTVRATEIAIDSTMAHPEKEAATMILGPSERASWLVRAHSEELQKSG